jgi:hypothetical protein
VTHTTQEIELSEAALSQIMAAIRRLDCRRAAQPNPSQNGAVYDACQMPDILRGVLDEITPVMESFTRGVTRAALDVLVSQGKITLDKHSSLELYTLKVC